MMNETAGPGRLNTWRLIRVPALISLALTLLRVIGERQHWSDQWFSATPGGVIPSGVGWIVGITWLVVPFGVYFAWKLAAAGQGPPQTGKAIGCAVAGLAIWVGGHFYLAPRLPIGFPPILIYIWAVMALAAAISWLGWPALSKILLAYGLAARIPVVIVMFFAMRGRWGTHYDYAGAPPQFDMSLWPKFFWLAFFPQLIFWVGFTILIGSLAGSVAAALRRERKSAQRQSPEWQGRAAGGSA